uniref:GigA/Nc25 cyclic peptide homeolog f n=1 Tax=Epichloe coenophiala TaxID=5047 RepID=A0A346R908_EPICN|nr:GigA/Nc25 cyclic peptide homeolog f [Epichloe coenophiala]
MQFTWILFYATLAAFGLAAPSEQVGRDVVQEGDKLDKRPNFKIRYSGADLVDGDDVQEGDKLAKRPNFKIRYSGADLVDGDDVQEGDKLAKRPNFKIIYRGADMVDGDDVQEGDELAKRPNFKMPYRGADIARSWALAVPLAESESGQLDYIGRFRVPGRGAQAQGTELDHK